MSVKPFNVFPPRSDAAADTSSPMKPSRRVIQDYSSDITPEDEPRLLKRCSAIAGTVLTPQAVLVANPHQLHGGFQNNCFA